MQQLFDIQNYSYVLNESNRFLLNPDKDEHTLSTDMRMTTILDNIYTRKISDTNYGTSNKDKSPYLGIYSLVKNDKGKYELRVRDIKDRVLSDMPITDFVKNSKKCFELNGSPSISEQQVIENNGDPATLDIGINIIGESTDKPLSNLGPYVVKTLPHLGVYGIINSTNKNVPSRIRFGAQLFYSTIAPDDYPEEEASTT